MPVIDPFNMFRPGVKLWDIKQKNDTELLSEFKTIHVEIYSFIVLLAATPSGVRMWESWPPDRDNRWLKVMVDIYCLLLYNISVNMNTVTVTLLCYSNNIIKYNSIEREYKDYFKKALHLSTLAQSTGHSCLMYLIRIMTIYDCFYIVKVYIKI